MNVITIIILLSLGLTLILVELLFIPGTALVGLLGGAVALAGLAGGFYSYGVAAGALLTLAYLSITAGIVFLSLRNRSWQRFSLKTALRGGVDEPSARLSVGDRGQAVSALRPGGKAEFATGQYEVRTLGDYLASGTPVEVVSSEKSRIIVRPYQSQ